MSTAADALVAMLTTHAGLVALVGGSAAAARIAPGFLPQGSARPAITYQRISNVPESAMGVDIGLAHARYQVNVWAADYPSGDALRTEVKSATRRKRGTFGGVVVQDTFIENDADMPEPGLDVASGGATDFHMPIDVLLHYQET